MSNPIIGVTVGTPISPSKIEEVIKPVKTVSGVSPDSQGNVELLPKTIGASPKVHTHIRSQITDFPTSMPASDVYSWAKATSKPTYTASEVGASPTDHNQPANTITAGTLAGKVVANSDGQEPSESLLRNSKLLPNETNPTVNGEICWVYA